MNYIWGKILKDKKIVNDYTLNLNNFSYDEFYEYLKELCYNLKIETPILLSKHQNQFEEYNMTRFSKDDFIDFITFDYLMIEHYED
ncbi:MAG: hypothetical protein E7359_01285 [Clostridiales bacterium]|nr:hypothetical protein [Clostridiales bacterium]